MLCIPAHVTLEVQSSPGLFALGVFPKVIHFSPRNLLALSTVAQNWIICLPHSLKFALFGYILFFSRYAMEKAVVGLKGIQLEQKHKCRIPYLFCFVFWRWWKNLSLPGALWERKSADPSDKEKTDLIVSWETF